MLYKIYLPILLMLLARTVIAHSPGTESLFTPAQNKVCQQNATLTAECSKTPGSVFDNSGTLWTIFNRGNHIYVTHSVDNGKSFVVPVRVNSEAEDIAAYGENRPQIAIGNNQEIYVSWIRKIKRRNADEVRFAYSVDHGKTFSRPVTINDDGIEASHRYNSMIVDNTGDVTITWLDKRDAVNADNNKEDYTGTAIYYARSSDHGKTFHANKKIADHSCECCRVTTQLDPEGHVVVLWRHIFDGDIRDHAIAKLGTNHSTTTAHITRVTFDEWNIDACPHHGPHMDIDASDNIHLVWFNGKEGQAGLHYARYERDDGKLHDHYHFDTSPTASRPQIKLFKNKIYIIWKRMLGNKMVVQMMTSDNNGISWSSEETLLKTDAGSDHPQLIADKDVLLASWWTKDQGMRIKALDKTETQTSGNHLQAFQNNSLKTIEQRFKDNDFLMVLWSLDCPPCFQEMELLSQYHKANKLPGLILISSNSEDELDAIQATLKKFELEDVDNWYFDGIVEGLRYQIDPTWYGELPRSYFYDNQGDRHTHKGLLKQVTLEKWLNHIAEQSR